MRAHARDGVDTTTISNVMQLSAISSNANDDDLKNKFYFHIQTVIEHT